MAKHPIPQPGAVFEAAYPYVREVYNPGDPEFEAKTWKPGTRAEITGPEDSEFFCDALGKIVLTVVSTHRPGKYPTRVFYIRKWRDPDGLEFGKPALRSTTVSAFCRLARGYRHPYSVKDAA